MEDPELPRPQWPAETPLFWATHSLVRTLLKLLFRLQIEGLEHYPSGAAVIVANHPSAVDPLFLAAATPERVLYIGAEEFLTLRAVGWAMRTYGCIPVRRGEVDLSAIRGALDALRARRKVVVFPEGRVSPDPAPPHRGAALIAAQARVPIVPAAIEGTGRVFPLGARVPRLGRVRVRFGPPVPPPGTQREEMHAALGAAMAWVRRAVASSA